MPIDASIPLQVKPPDPIDPLAQYGKLFQLRTMQQQAQAGALENQQRAQTLKDMQLMDQAWQQPGGRDAVLNALPGHLKMKASQQFMEIDKLHAETQEAMEKAATAQADAFGRAAVAVREHDYEPLAAQAFLSDLKTKYAGDPQTSARLAQFEQQIQSNPTKEAIKAVIDPIIAQSSQRKVDIDAQNAAARAKAAETGAARLDAEKPKIALEATRLQQETTGSVPMTAAQTAQKKIEEARLSLARQKNDRDQKTFEATIGSSVPGSPGAAAPDPVAQAIAEYRLAPPAARSLSTAGGQALMKRVSAINPDFDATQFPNRNKTRQSFTTGVQGQQINAMNTAIGHLDQLGSAIAGLDNGDVQVVNQAKNWLKTQLGSPSTTNFDTLKVALSGELASVLKKSGATDAEIKHVESTIAAKNSPAQLAGYVQTQIPILGSKLSALNYQYHQAMGEKDPFSALSPEAKGVLTKHGFDPANPTVGEQKTGGPDLSGLKPGHGRTFSDGPFKGQTWTIGADGQPKQVKAMED